MENERKRQEEGVFVPHLVVPPKPPSVESLAASARLDRQEIDRIASVVSSLERDQSKMDTEIDAMAEEEALSRKGKSSITKLWWFGALVLIIGVVAFGIGLRAKSEAAAAKAETGVIKTDLTDFRKEIKVELDANKVDLDKIRESIRVVGVNADRSVTGLSGDLKQANNLQDDRLNDIDTALMSKAELENVKSVANKIRRTNKSLTRLEQQMLELRTQLQAQLPKTM